MGHICPLLLLLAAAPQQQAPPTFRSDVRVVPVDVSVLDAQRHPITGLRAEDFIILEDGLARPLVAFAAIEHS